MPVVSHQEMACIDYREKVYVEFIIRGDLSSRDLSQLLFFTVVNNDHIPSVILCG